MPQKIITYSFYILFILTPLFFTPLNSELFEYNKMMLVYLLTIVITGTWVIKSLQEKRLILKRTPLDIPLLLFLLSQFLSTIFSIDPHTSWWGYYSRSNGGLLSIISYILLFYALVSNFTKEDIPNILKSILIGGLITALYAIPEHFGVSPSCVILTQTFTASCWVQDVQARVFATLGQPNWLGAYMAMLIPLALYFVLTAKTKSSTILYTLYSILFYLGLTFTYSRGAFLGFLVGLGVFMVSLLFCHPEGVKRPKDIISFASLRITIKQGWLKSFAVVIFSFLLVNLLFGSALTRFKILNFSPPAASQTAAAPSAVTQLESGGTESGQIRLIVWQGALEIFKHYPIFGSGVETFAYSYYNFRPLSHNLVSEWDFLYNKAHNEYLNYLATTGLFGLITYLAVILTFLIWVGVEVLGVRRKNSSTHTTLLLTALLAGYTSYLVQNFFGFSVVIIALLFYIFPGLAFVWAEDTKKLVLPKRLEFLNQLFTSSIYKRPVYKNLAIFVVTLISIFLISVVIRFWIADTLYKRGSDYLDLGNPGRGYNYLLGATTLNSDEPLYRSELGYAAASASLALLELDATRAASLKETAIEETNKALTISPKNVSLWRTAIRTFYELSLIDPEFEQKTLETLDKTIALAPTDAKLYYNKALVLTQLGRNEEAVEVFEKALQLKPNYREAYFTLGVAYKELKQKDQAIGQFQNVLKLVPNDPDAIEQIQELQGSNK